MGYETGLLTRYGTGVTSASIQRTTPAIPDCCGALFVINADATVTDISVTINGVAATFVDRTGTEGEAISGELWVMPGLAASTLHTAVATITGGTGSECTLIFVILSGCDPTTPVRPGSATKLKGTSNGASINVPSAIGDLVLDMIVHNFTGTMTEGAGQTNRHNDNTSDAIACSTKAGASPDVAMAWTTPGFGGAWAQLGASFQPASGGGAVDLVIADAAHGHTTDSFALTQQYTLAIQEGLHGLPTDSFALTQDHVLVVQEAQHGHAADNLALIQSHVLAVADALHAQFADNLDLSFVPLLQVNEANHALLSTVPTLELMGFLVLQGSILGHTADNLTLTQQNVLAVQDSLHTHIVDALSIGAVYALSINDALHLLGSEAPVLGVQLSVNESYHGHFVDNLILSQQHQLVVADASHVLLSDNIFLIYGDAAPMEYLELLFGFTKLKDIEFGFQKTLPLTIGF